MAWQPVTKPRAPDTLGMKFLSCVQRISKFKVQSSKSCVTVSVSFSALAASLDSPLSAASSSSLTCDRSVSLAAAAASLCNCPRCDLPSVVAIPSCSAQCAHALCAAAGSLPPDLSELVRSGVSVHHGGLDHRVRTIIEQLFIKSVLRVVVSVCTLRHSAEGAPLDLAARAVNSPHLWLLLFFAPSATSTLGQGVNLPAHMVIIRGTTHWSEGGMSEMTGSDLMQMIGRAGRPQFDKDGVAVVMTSDDKLATYSQLLKGQHIESRLFERIIEHLNAEVVAAGTATHMSCMRSAAKHNSSASSSNACAACTQLLLTALLLSAVTVQMVAPDVHVHSNENQSEKILPSKRATLGCSCVCMRV